MSCPDPETLQALVDHELPADRRAELIAHVSHCENCVDELRLILLIAKGLDRVVSSEPCPSMQELTEYLSGTLDPDTSTQIQAHLPTCEQCQAVVDYLGASPDVLAAMEREAQDEFKLALAEDMGKQAAGAALDALLPGRQGLLDRLWEKVADLSRGFRDLQPVDLPRLGQSNRLAGALGFSSAPDPEVLSAAVILTTALAASHRVLDESDRISREQLAGICGDYAKRFGAGRELATRLAEILPPLLTP